MQPAGQSISVGLNAVILSVDGDTPQLLIVPQEGGGVALPFGPFDPARHRTFEIGLRRWVAEQAHFQLGYVEQLYTFGDRGRDAVRLASVATALDLLSQGVDFFG